MPQIDIRLASSADDSGFRKIHAASQNLDASFKRVERGLDQLFRAFRPERIVQSLISGAGIGSAFAIINRLTDAATANNRKLADSIDAVKKSEEELAKAREQIARATRTSRQNLTSDQFDLQAVEARIDELKGLIRTITSKRELFRRGPNGEMVGTGEFVDETRTVGLTAAQNNELARLTSERAQLLTSIAVLERQIAAEQDRQVDASNKLVEQFYAQRDAKKKKEEEDRNEKLNARLVKLGEAQADAEFAKLPPLEQINQLLAEDARLREESLRLNLDDIAQLERGAEIEERRLEIAKSLATAYRSAAAAVDQMLSRQLGALGREKALISADPALTDMEKRQRLIPLLEQERDLLNNRVAALEREVQLAADPEVQKLLEMRLESLRGLQSSNAGALMGANPATRTQQNANAVRDLSDPTKHYQSVGDGARGGFLGYLTQLGTMADQVAAGIENTLGAAVNGITQGIYGWITGAMTFRQMMVNIGSTVLQSVLQMIVQMGVRMLLNAVLGKTLQAAAAAAAIATAAATAAPMSAIWAGPATLATIATLGGAAAQAPLSILAAKGIVLASSITGFAEGGLVRGPGTATSDSILARLSNGEAVLNARATGMLGEDFINALNADPINAIARPYQAGASEAAQSGGGFGGNGGRELNIALLNPHTDRDIIEQMESSPRADTYFVRMLNKHRHTIPGVRL